MPVNTHIRGLRQGIPGGFVLGRSAGKGVGAVTAIPIPVGLSSTGANATATAGGFVPQQSVGTSGVGFNNAGAWSSSAAYNPGDVVTFNGGAYVNYVAVSSPGPNPSPDMDDTHWLSQGALNTVGSGLTLSGGQVSVTPGQIPGTNTNSSATAGNVGEYVSSAILFASGVNCGNNAVTNITSIALTAGDWDVGANIVIDNGGGATITNAQGIIATTNSGVGDESQRALLVMAGISTFGVALGTQRFLLASSGNVFLNVFVSFGAGAVKGSGLLWARRMR